MDYEYEGVQIEQEKNETSRERMEAFAKKLAEKKGEKENGTD